MYSGFVHLMMMVSTPPYFSRFWHSNKDLGISFSISRPFKWLRIDWYVLLLSVYLTAIARDLTSFSTPPTLIHYAPRLTITQLFMYISPFYYLIFSFIMFTLYLWFGVCTHNFRMISARVPILFNNGVGRCWYLGLFVTFWLFSFNSGDRLWSIDDFTGHFY